MKISMKFVVLALLSALLIASFTTAQLCSPSGNTLRLCITSTLPTQTSPGTTIPITFTVDYTSSITRTLDFSGSSINQGSWNGLPVGQNATNETLEFTGNLVIPTTATGTINAELEVDTTTGAVSSAAINFSMSVINTGLEMLVETPVINAGQNATIRLRNNANTAINSVVLSEISNFGVSFASNGINLTSGQTTNPISVKLTQLSNLNFGNNVVTLKAVSGDFSDQESFTVEKSFCDQGPIQTNLSIDRLEINNDGDGEDQEWELLDEIRVEVKVENNGDNDIDSVIVLGLFDSEGQQVADDLIYLASSDGNEDEIEVQIDEEEDVEVTFEFIVPADLETGSYRLAIKALDDDAGENEGCTDRLPNNALFETIDVNTKDDEDDSMAIDDFDFPVEVACGETLSGSFRLFNVGDSNEDRVRVDVRNTQLGLNEFFEVTNFDRGDDTTFDLVFQVPSNIRDGTYNIEFLPRFDYGRGEYDRTGNSFTYPLRVTGCSGTGSGNGQVAVTADLDSEAVAGELLAITLSVTNTGTTTQNFVIEPINYQSWAEIDSISERTVDLAPGQTRQIIVRLNIDESASGSQDFAVNVISGGRVFTQPLEVNIEGSNGSSVGNIFAGWFQGNSLVWAIAIINIVLIVLIIFVAIRVARR